MSSPYSQYTQEDFERQYNRKQMTSANVAWHNPVTDAIHVSYNKKNPEYADQMMVIPKAREYSKALEMESKGELDSDKAQFGFINQRDGWPDIFNERYSALEQRSYGVMTPGDFSAIEVTNVLSTMLGLPERNFVLQDAATTIPTPYLDVRADTWSGFDVAEDIKLGAQIPTAQGSFAATTYTLKLNGAHVARYDELEMRPHYWDIFRVNVENVARRMVKKKAQLIGTELETATGVGGADWGALTSGLSTNNPLDQIGGVADTIVSNDGNPNTVALSDRALRDLVSSTFVKGTAQNMTPNQMNQPGAAKVLTIPSLPYTFYADNLMTNTVAVVYDKQAIAAFQGPQSVSTYRDETHRFEGYLVADYFLTKITQSSKIRKLTTVSA